MTAFAAYLEQNLALTQAALDDRQLGAAVARAVALLAEALGAGLPLLVCGNGGSASDAMHIAGELVGRFQLERRAYNALALSANPATLTAWSNDYSFDSVFARQVQAHGRAGGVLWGISTSGNSPNVLQALAAAREMGMHTLGLTGEGGGKMAALCDVLLAMPARETARIQELHICTYHHICAQVEQSLSAVGAVDRIS